MRSTLEVQKIHREGVSHAFVGDPLDVDSGFSLTTTSESADDAIATCDAPFDAARYLVNNDGTVTDAYSGLMWQRCPLGYVLNPQNTATEFQDDTCDSAVDSRRTWQSALQAAASDASAGHDDWRVPSIKELESIVDLHVHGAHGRYHRLSIRGAILHLVFHARSLEWGGREGHRLRVRAGDLASPDRQCGYATGTRQRSRAAAPYCQRISVGRAVPVDENDAGTSVLSFPIALDAVASTDVSVEYADPGLFRRRG